MSGWSSPSTRRLRARVSSSSSAGLLDTHPTRAGRRRGCSPRCRVSGWSSPSTRRLRARVSSSSSRACSLPHPTAHRSMARLFAEVRVSGWSSPSTRRLRARVSSSSVPGLPIAHPTRTGRWRGCWPRPGCRGGPRPAPGGCGPGCPPPARGPAGSHPTPDRSRARLLAEVRVSGWSSPSTRRLRARVSSLRVRACSIVTQRGTGRGRGCWPSEGVGVVLAQDPASAGQGVLVEGAGLLVLTQRVQVEGEVAGRGEGVGVVLAQNPASAGQGVLVEGAGLLVAHPTRTGRGRGCWPR